MIYIILIIITIFVYLIYKSVKNKPEKAKQVNVKEILHTAQENKKKILDKCKKQRYDLYQDEVDMVEAVEIDIIRLQERYKHNSEMVMRVLNDYLDYTNALLKIINANILDEAKSSVGYGDDINNLEDYHRETMNPRIIIQEIGKRIMEMAGDDSKYKMILNKPSSCVLPADAGKVKIRDRYK